MNLNNTKILNIICYNIKKCIIENFKNNYYEDLETMDNHGITDSYFEYILKKDWGNLFLQIINEHKPKVFLEIGVFCGVTARNVCELLKEVHKKKLVI